MKEVNMNKKMAQKELQAKAQSYYKYIIDETAKRILLKDPNYLFEIKRINLDRRVSFRSIPKGDFKKALRASPYIFTVLKNNTPSPHIEIEFFRKIKAMISLLESQDRFSEMNITEDDFILAEMLDV